METNTIIEIKKLRDSIDENLLAYRKKLKTEQADMNVGQYGSESEYSLNSLIGGIKNILTDVSYLVKAHDIFIKISTCSERSELQSSLSSLNSYIVGSNHRDIASQLDTIKTSLRKYNLRFCSEHFVEFNSEIDTLRKKAISMEGDIKEVLDNLEASKKLFEEITSTKTNYDESFSELESERDELIQKVSDFNREFLNLEVLVATATTNESTIAEKLDDAKESEAKFNEFIAKISEREVQLNSQKKSTENYTSKLGEFETEHGKKLSEVQNLIDKALIALQYTTAGGISKAFQDQYDKSNHKWTRLAWLIAAGIFVLVTILLGVWIVLGWGMNQDNNNVNIYAIIGRLSMMPFTLLGALFCANQYVKQKSLIEDYAYKMVLSKSIVAFSEELRAKDDKGYTEYISTVLREIHQDPLRKRDKEKDEVSVKDSAGLIDKIVDLLKVANKV